jgi:hypothetical protein
VRGEGAHHAGGLPGSHGSPRGAPSERPSIATENGLADFGSAKAAWFKDSEGNTYELTEVAG